MSTIIKMARRNIWRNKRRTLITAASIMFAVFFAIVMNAFQEGAWDGMVYTMVNSYYGFGQVQQKDYFDERTIDNAVNYEDAVAAIGKDVNNVEDLAPRLENFTLISTGEETKVGLLIGTDPDKEQQLSGLKDKLIAGEYLKNGEQAVLLSDTMAKDLGLDVGDTLILIGQGYQGRNAAGKYPIKGLLQFPVNSMSQMIYMPIAEAQEFFGAYDLATSIIVDVENPNRLKQTLSTIESKLTTEEYAVISWEQLMPEILKTKEMKTSSSKITFYILYLIIGFGIFGTILMMIKERQYEFGVLTALGMKRSKLGFIVFIETLFIGLLGVLAGSLIAFPMVYYFHINPVDIGAISEDARRTYQDFGVPTEIPFSLTPKLFISEAITIFFILAILAIYPFITILKLKPVEAMRA